MIWALVFGAIIASSCALNIPDYKYNIFNPENNDAALSAMCDDVAHKFETEYIDYMRTGIESPALRTLSQQLAKSHTKRIITAEIENLSSADQIFLCTTCRATTRVIIRMFREGGELEGPESEDILRKTMLDFCERFEIQTEEICAGLFESNYPIIRFIIDETKLDSKTFCGTFMQASFCKVTDPSFNFKINIDSKVTPISGPKTDIPPKGANDLNILHITDIHYDPLYLPGSLAECDEPQCCQRHKGTAEGTSKAAGHWGDYRDCDTPWHTFEDSLAHITKSHKKIDYVYHTGDVIDHVVWMTSRESNTKSLQQVNKKLKDTFGDTLVFPTIGNHENHPLNVFAPPDVTDSTVSTKWLYDLLADLWSVWLPSSTQATIKKGGYYTVSPSAGFRIIALNNNDCYVFNWWIMYDSNYLSQQLQWLHDTLLQAEKDKEYVHILTHIPTGSGGCWNVWSREFARIVERFRHTISGIFNGHTHSDELSVYYSNDTTPINVAWNGGSLTPFSEKNPNYKIYQVEPKSFQVVDQEVWYFNLTAANLKPDESPKWEVEYKFAEEFKVKDLSPASIDGLLVKFAEQPKLLRKYWEYHSAQGDPRLAKGCDNGCLKNFLCYLATSDNTQTVRCEQLKEKIQETFDNEEEESSGSGSGSGSGDGDDDGGAAAIIGVKITTLVSIYLGLRFFF